MFASDLFGRVLPTKGILDHDPLQVSQVFHMFFTFFTCFLFFSNTVRAKPPAMEEVEDVDEPCETEERGAGFADSPSAGKTQSSVPPYATGFAQTHRRWTRDDKSKSRYDVIHMIVDMMIYGAHLV